MNKNLIIGILFAFFIMVSGVAYAAAPIITNSTPIDGIKAIKTNSNVTVTVNDTDGNLMNITFSMWNGTAWTQIQKLNNRANGRHVANANGFFIKPYTEYTWKVNVTDSTGESAEKISTFTTGDLLKLKWMTDIGALTTEEQVWPLVGDIDKDGTIEVVFEAKTNVYALNGKTGAIEWTVPGARRGAIELADVNNDGTPEVITVTNDLRVRVINGNGTIRWTSAQVKGEDVPVFPLLAYDIDGDGYPTIYIATQDAHPEPYSGNDSEYEGALTKLDHNGNILVDTHLVKPCWGGISLADSNYDGRFEVYVSDRRDGFVNIPSEGLRVYYADTLEPIWSRPDLQHSSPMGIIDEVYPGGNLEVIAQPITLRGPMVLNATDGSTIKDYQNKGLPTHAVANTYDIDNDGNLEIIMGTSYPTNAPMDFAVFDLVTGQTDFRPNFTYHTTWPPNVGSVTPDGEMQILASMGNQGWLTDFPLLIYDSEFNLIDQINIPGAGQLIPPRVYDIDGDGLNEVLITGVRGKFFVYDTLAPTRYPQPRADVQQYSEFRRGAAEFVDYPGPLAPFVISTNPVDGAVNVSANPKITIRAVDFQKDRFNVSFEVYQGFQWRQLAKYTNVTNGNFTSNSSPYVTDPSTEYKWRVTLTDAKGNSKQYEYTFTTTDNINTTKPIVEAISPADYQGAFTLSSLVFNISDNGSMTYNVTTIPNVGSAYVSGVPSGQYSVPVSGLVNNQEYIWRIEVTDGSSITYKEYHFSTPYELNISVTGNGVVTTNPLPPFAKDTVVNLTAVPNPGNTFMQWVGDVTNYSNPLIVNMNSPKVLTARFRQETGKAIADGEFDQSLTNLELVENAPYQDWWESRNQGDYRYLLPEIDTNNIGGNTGKKLKLKGNTSGNAYITQEFLTPFDNTFSLQWDVYVDNILNISGTADKAAIMLIGTNVPPHANGPNYQASRNFVWLAFYKLDGAETGTMNLVTTLNNASEMVLATDVALDTWHTIKVDGNLNTDTYDVYLDNVLVGSGVTARTNKTNVTHISFAQWNDGAGTFYIDNVGEPSGPIVCVDADSDGYNVTGSSCGPVDCNDANPAINPGATEVCDGVDNNCVGGIDEGLTSTYYADSDTDLFGNPLVSQNACSMPLGYVTDNTDCNDANASINPSETEVCDNSVDDNCDGNVDEGCSIGLVGWDHRKSITIDSGSVVGNVNSFPVLITLDDADLASKAQADGDDIVFTDSDGLTILDYEIESYDSGALIAWVETDVSSSTDKVIYMYYGNAGAASSEDPENVWNDYEAVHHFEESSGSATDSSSNNNDGTLLNGVVQGASGKIGDAYSFDGINDRVVLPQIFNGQNTFTVEAWANSASKQGYVVSQRDGIGNGFFIQYYPLENNFQTYTNSRILRRASSANQWHHVVAAYDGTNTLLYVDGVSVSGTATITWPALQTIIGDRSAQGRAYQGSIDEVRISHDYKSQEYILNSYINQDNPTAFYTVGSEE